MELTFFRELGVFEIAFIAFFILLYVLYISRTIRIAKQVKSNYDQVIIKLLIRSFYFALMIVALLGPSFGSARKEVKSQGKDIYFLVDLSRSMDADDIQPSRLERTKFELKNLVEKFSSDRLGLIIFSSEAFLQCPLTFDRSALLLFIETLNTGLLSNTGTEFSPAIEMAIDKHKNAEENVSGQQQSKIIVLISDGEDFGTNASEIAEELKDEGIRLFTVGVGTQEGSKIPQGYRFQRSDSGTEVITKLKPESLQEIAEITGGSYFEINDKVNEIPQLIREIENIEGELRSTKEIDAAANRYFLFLLAAFVLLIIDVIISVKVIRI
ncbi:vWA domain-containing protein [Chondrinema litorale]|uniref:vWA domain-containing protein n=1 Tax=Chondrinema litorale TaxID=2994555 RepID=UPI00254381D2|nr:VWA domain-containing protein [Chondrinema litorale]UZR94258.1 VWA domain-containing protein [Chondrinema litorale]